MINCSLGGVFFIGFTFVAEPVSEEVFNQFSATLFADWFHRPLHSSSAAAANSALAQNKMSNTMASHNASAK